LTREEEMNIIRACHDRRDWMHPERSIPFRDKKYSREQTGRLCKIL
jgi:hypothetical protein